MGVKKINGFWRRCEKVFLIMGNSVPVCISHGPTRKYTDVYKDSEELDMCVTRILWICSSGLRFYYWDTDFTDLHGYCFSSPQAIRIIFLSVFICVHPCPNFLIKRPDGMG